MNCRVRMEQYLRENKVPFEVQHHAVAYTAQEVAASEHLPGARMAKVVMVMADKKLAMVVTTANKRVDLDKAASTIGASDVRLAREDEFAVTFPECEVGAEPPFGNLFGVPVYLDPAVSKSETIFFQAGTHVDTMSLRYDDFVRLVQPKIGDVSVH